VRFCLIDSIRSFFQTGLKTLEIIVVLLRKNHAALIASLRPLFFLAKLLNFRMFLSNVFKMSGWNSNEILFFNACLQAGVRIGK
jgi:hypothetical protein